MLMASKCCLPIPHQPRPLPQAAPRSPSDAASWIILRYSPINVLQAGPIIFFSNPTSCSKHSLIDVFLCLCSASQGMGFLAEAQQLHRSHPYHSPSFILYVHHQLLLIPPFSHFSVMPYMHPHCDHQDSGHPHVFFWFIFCLACKSNYNFPVSKSFNSSPIASD